MVFSAFAAKCFEALIFQRIVRVLVLFTICCCKFFQQ